MAEDFRSRMQIFVDFPAVEREMQVKVQRRVSDILLSKAINGGREPIDVIADYLNHSSWEERLKVLVGLSGGSLEKLKRVCLAILPREQKYSDIRREPKVRRAVAKFLVQPDSYKNVPAFIRGCFALRENWLAALQDEVQLTAVVRNALLSDYAVQIGFAQEQSIVRVVEGLSLTYEKGAVEMVDNKEVDVAIPNVAEPEILIMSSYALTTASSQSSRAKEQTLMYEEVLKHNRRRGANVRFVNVIDGGGWIERKNDLQKIITQCDQAFTNSDIADGLLRKYLIETLHR